MKLFNSSVINTAINNSAYSSIFDENERLQIVMNPDGTPNNRLIWDAILFILDDMEFPYNRALNMVIIPKGLFKGDKDITSFKIPEIVSTIKKDAFNGSSIEDVEFDTAYLNGIESGAFANCNNLKQLTLNIDNVEDNKQIKVSTDAFSGTPALKRLILNGVHSVSEVKQFFKNQIATVLKPLISDRETIIEFDGKKFKLDGDVDRKGVNREFQNDNLFNKSDFKPTLSSYVILDSLNINDLKSNDDYWTFGW